MERIAKAQQLAAAAKQNARIAVTEARNTGDQANVNADAAVATEGSPAPGKPTGGGKRDADPMAPVTPGWTRIDARDAPPHVRQAAADFKPRISGHPRKTTAVYNGRIVASGGRQTELADDLAYERIPRTGERPYSRAPNVLYEHPR
jgi:hypothetical protein